MVMMLCSWEGNRVPTAFVLLQVFKRLFNDGLDIQKERIRELRKYAKEQRQERTRRQWEELEALENLYPCSTACRYHFFIIIWHLIIFTICYDLKLLLTKFVGGGHFFRTQCSRVSFNNVYS